jgi:hypothetical protein
MGPTKLFDITERSTRFVKLPKTEGTFPPNELLETSKL